MESEIIPIESITERDIDVLLVEEFYCNVEFCKWLCEKLELPPFNSLNNVLRSISKFGLGETDILLNYNSNNCRILLLIENKIDATFTKNQGMRYIQRANKYVEQQDCSKAYEVLIAPKNYCENQIEFKRYITYESVHEFFEGKGLRFEFKGKLLKIGIERLRRGFAVVNSNENQTFWSQYWELVCSEFPELYMKKPNVEIPVGSDWPIVYTILEPKLKFVHKFEQKCVDYSFTRPDNSKMDLIRSLMSENMSFKITKTGNLLLKLESPFINRLIDFSNQKNDLRIGLNNMLKLRTFLIENQLC